MGTAQSTVDVARLTVVLHRAFQVALFLRPRGRQAGVMMNAAVPFRVFNRPTRHQQVHGFPVAPPAETEDGHGVVPKGKPRRRLFESLTRPAELPKVLEIRVAGHKSGVLGFHGSPVQLFREFQNARAQVAQELQLVVQEVHDGGGCACAQEKRQALVGDAVRGSVLAVLPSEEGLHPPRGFLERKRMYRGGQEVEKRPARFTRGVDTPAPIIEVAACQPVVPRQGDRKAALPGVAQSRGGVARGEHPVDGLLVPPQFAGDVGHCFSHAAQTVPGERSDKVPLRNVPIGLLQKGINFALLLPLPPRSLEVAIEKMLDLHRATRLILVGARCHAQLARGFKKPPCLLVAS